MGRPLEKSDCDELGAYIHKRNIVCSFNLLEALQAAHGGSNENNPPSITLQPIPNEAIAEASRVAFPSWVGAIKRIQHAVCAEYGITMTELLSQRRHKKIVRPRHVAMYLCKTLTDRSFPEIGRRFGGRDHTTTINAVQRVERLCATDEVFRIQIEAFAESLGGSLA